MTDANPIQPLELVLTTEASPERLEALRQALLALHREDNPEWIHRSAVSAGADGQWLAESLSPDAGPPAP